MSLSSKFTRSIFVLIVVLALLIPVSIAFAGSVSGTVNMGVTCTTLTFSGGGNIHWDRDTTGTGAEAIILEVVDGLGNVVFYGLDSRLVGQSAGFSPAYAYTSSPAANPITARIYSPAGNGLAEQTILEVTGTCVGLPGANSPGPGVPAGFVLRTITCETPVYNTAAGQPVGSGMIHAGQTWYVNPTPVDGADGISWTEIFNGGRVNGFIPTSCVGG